MPKLRDLTGERFGRLLVLYREPAPISVGAFWRCVCECGTETVVSRGNLLNKSTSSCGCLRNTQGGLARKHPLWKRWAAIISRCTSENDKDFPNYGGRGIKVCQRWLKFENFLADMEFTFAPGLTIESRDVNGPYDPLNCEWATPKKQGRNKRKSFMIDTPWGRMNVAEAAERAGINRGTLRRRVRAGWSIAKIFDPQKFHRFTSSRQEENTEQN